MLCSGVVYSHFSILLKYYVFYLLVSIKKHTSCAVAGLKQILLSAHILANVVLVLLREKHSIVSVLAMKNWYLVMPSWDSGGWTEVNGER